MHYQANSVLKPEMVISTLLAEFPSFAESVDIEEAPYSILSDFAIYLRDGITNDTVQADELNHAFSFLNAMGASDDLEVQNQLVVGVLEILADTDESLSVAKRNLKGQALELFRRTLSGWVGGGGEV